jgi:hypothetical protein
MDVISLGKANKAYKNIVDLDEKLVALQAEGRFHSVDARLDWLQDQAEKSGISVVNQVDLRDGVFSNTELVGGKVMLKFLYTIDNGYGNDAVPIMTGNTTSGVTVTASGVFGNQYPWYAFDGSLGTFWYVVAAPAPAGGHWIKVDLGAGVKKRVGKLRLQPANIRTSQCSVKDWKLFGSDDDISYTEVAAGTHANNESKEEYIFSNPNSYRYYRLNVISNYDTSDRTAGYVEIYDMELIPLDATNYYAPTGTWESPVIDLGGGWLKTNLVELVKDVAAAGSTAAVEVASSVDGQSFTAFAPLNAGAPPSGQYLKFKITLTSPSQAGTTKAFDFNQSDVQNKFALSFAIADGTLRLKTNHSFPMNSGGALGAGKLFSAPIQKSLFKVIERIEVS